MFCNFRMINIFLVKIFICICFVTLPAQNKTSEKGRIDEPTTCEYIKNALDYSLVNAKNDEGTYIIIIIHLGEGETSKTLYQSRVNFIRKYLNFRNPNFNQIVFAQGEKASGLGKIEIYLGGKPEWKISLKKNKSGWASCIE